MALAVLGILVYVVIGILVGKTPINRPLSRRIIKLPRNVAIIVAIAILLTLWPILIVHEVYLKYKKI